MGAQWRRPGDAWTPGEVSPEQERRIRRETTWWLAKLLAKGLGLALLVQSPLLIGKLGGLLGWWSW